MRVSEEFFLRLLEELRQYVVIVEGKKDKEALKTLGVKNIIAINSKPLLDIVNTIRQRGDKEVIILTDFDKQGRKIEAKLRNLLQRYKIHTNEKLRWKMMRVGKNNIEDFRNEGIAGTIPGSINGGDIHGEISANINKIHYQSKDTSKRSYRKTRRHRGHIRSDRRPAGG